MCRFTFIIELNCTWITLNASEEDTSDFVLRFLFIQFLATRKLHHFTVLIKIGATLWSFNWTLSSSPPTSFNLSVKCRAQFNDSFRSFSLHFMHEFERDSRSGQAIRCDNGKNSLGTRYLYNSRNCLGHGNSTSCLLITHKHTDITLGDSRIPLAFESELRDGTNGKH